MSATMPLLQRTLLAAAVFLTLGLSGARAEEGPVATPFAAVHLPDVGSAERYAGTLIQEMKAQGQSEIVFIHLGDSAPRQLRWLMVQLEAAQIHSRLEVISRESGQAALAELYGDLSKDLKVAEVVTHPTAGSAETNELPPRKIHERATSFLRELYGIPHGLTFSVRWSPPPGGRKVQLSTAFSQAMVAGLSLTTSLYTASHYEFTPYQVIGITTFMA